jgi:hypothetical protein
VDLSQTWPWGAPLKGKKVLYLEDYSLEWAVDSEVSVALGSHFCACFACFFRNLFVG